ncbi:hypothetical protein CVT24_011363 [Panaeolus cyanescens]|uniref:DUF6534 domain-containing protein n=1 Tax=Panaeolus cyanescens TaxID=181874 RepID=A0A409YGT2_9AGAR|nr:hypothetical protein CVT24_011363 [Panaeolus cyanescens]
MKVSSTSSSQQIRTNGKPDRALICLHPALTPIQKYNMAQTTPVTIANFMPGLPTKFDNTLGALLLCGLFAMASMDTFHSALVTHILYTYMANNSLTPWALIKPVWSIMALVVVTSSASVRARIVANFRTRKLTEPPKTIIEVTATLFQITSFLDLYHNRPGLLYSWFGVSAAGDLFLCLAQLYLLRKSRTGFKRTDRIIRILMMYIVNTGMIVVFDASLTTVAYAAAPGSLISFSFYIFSAKRKSSKVSKPAHDELLTFSSHASLGYGSVYVNAYLATLNARKSLRKGDDNEMLSFKFTATDTTAPPAVAGLLYSWFAISAAGDLFLCLAQLYLLRKSRTGFKKTDRIIRILMMYIVNTGMIVVFDASLTTVTFAASPGSLISFSCYMLSAKLYVNAYLATLNARTSLCKEDNDEMLSFKFTTTDTTAPPAVASALALTEKVNFYWQI